MTLDLGTWVTVDVVTFLTLVTRTLLINYIVLNNYLQVLKVVVYHSDDDFSNCTCHMKFLNSASWMFVYTILIFGIRSTKLIDVNGSIKFANIRYCCYQILVLEYMLSLKEM